jgi:hypothetical protein
MSPVLCAICGTQITPENDSREHIILNAIGGRRTVSGFICGPCNSTAGHSWDATLAKQLNPFSLFFDISRQDGVPRAQEFPILGGGTIRVTSNGLELPKPTMKETTTETGAAVQIMARTMDEAKKILTGLKEKYPKIDIDATLAAATSKYSYLDHPIEMNLQIGGHDAGRSIVKSAFALAVASGVSTSQCEQANRYFASADDACFGYFYNVDLLEIRPTKTVVHCVAVQSTHDGLLLGYVELFSVFRMIVCLSSNYLGKPISAVYAVDPVTGTELDIEVRLRFSRADLNDIYDYRCIPDGAMAQALAEIIPEAMMRSFERERAAVTHRAIENAWRKLDLPPDTLLTHEHFMKLNALIVEEMQPFLLRYAQHWRAQNRAVGDQ